MAAADRPGALPTVDFAVDLSSHELLRRAHVLDALGSDWDPLAALRGEEAAYELLYSGLSADQQRVYDELVSAGVLPRRGTAMLPLDPQADIGRRAWVACPNCDDRRGCGTCEQGRTCSEHWRYLLSNVGSLLHLVPVVHPHLDARDPFRCHPLPVGAHHQRSATTVIVHNR